MAYLDAARCIVVLAIQVEHELQFRRGEALLVPVCTELASLESRAVRMSMTGSQHLAAMLPYLERFAQCSYHPLIAVQELEHHAVDRIGPNLKPATAPLSLCRGSKGRSQAPNGSCGHKETCSRDSSHCCSPLERLREQRINVNIFVDRCTKFAVRAHTAW